MRPLDLFRPSSGVFLAGLALLSSTVQQVSAFGQMVPYTGTLCKGYIDYNVWLPGNYTVDMIEAGLTASGLPQIAQLVDPCKSAFMAYACSAAYPRPVNSGRGDYNVLFACDSTCQAVNQICKADLTFLEMLPILPKCDAPISGTEEYGPIPHQPDNSCNSVPLQSSNTTCETPMEDCAPPFVRDKVFFETGKNTDDAYCGCGCCLPCPQTDAFYKAGLLDKGFFITDIIKGVSAALSLILVISYVFLPDKLQHPSNLILFAAIATCIFSSPVALSYGDPKRVQCTANGVTPAHSSNNQFCTAQGAWLLFGAISTTAWLSLVIINLHLHTVWNSNWLARRAWLSHILGWMFPAALVIVGVVTESFGWNNTNMCMVTQKAANMLMFIPLGVIMIPSVLLHMATFAHIIRVTLQSEGSETISHSTLSSGKAARISHRRHVLNAIRIQWRAAVLALVVSSAVLINWAFYIVEGAKTDMSWMTTWQLCIFTKQDQEWCAEQFAKGKVPDFVLMMVAEIVVSTTGIWIFLLFFKQSLILEWREMVSGWVCCGGRRQRKKEDEEFYVI